MTSDFKVAEENMRRILAPLFMELEQDNRKRESKAAKIDPLAHKKTRVFDGSAAYRYWQTKDGLGRTVRFCYSTHRNAAGFFLGWRETWNKKGTGKRDRWISRRKRNRVSEIMEARFKRFLEKHKAAQTSAGETNIT